jgi:hypothetical protein
MQRDQEAVTITGTPSPWYATTTTQQASPTT